MTNICYISHSHPFWLKLAEHLPESGYNVKMWIGNTENEPFAYNRFPNACIYPFVATHKGQTLQNKNVAHTPPQELYCSLEFIRLRDQVYKMMNRQDDFGKFRLLEREAIFYSIFTFFYSELKENKIDLCIASEAPHAPATFIIYSLCEMLGIKRVHFVPIPQTSAMWAQRGFEDQAVKIQRNDKKDLALEKALLDDYLIGVGKSKDASPVWYMQQHKAKNKNMLARVVYQLRAFSRKNKKGIMSFVAYKYRRITKPCYTIKSTYFLNEPESFNLLSKQHQKNAKRAQKKQLADRYKLLSSEVTPRDDIPYIYVPLHYEPERTTNPDGDKNYNTYDTLLALRDFVPEDIPIYVKEHPNQIQLHHMHGNRGRSAYFYDFCQQLPNVELLAFSESNNRICEQAEIVATTGGTASIEAAAKGKKALVFGFPWFSGCPNVFHIDQVKSFDSLVNKPAVGLEDVKAFFAQKLDRCGIRASCYEPMRKALSSSTGEPFDDAQGIADILAALEAVVDQR